MLTLLSLDQTRAQASTFLMITIEKVYQRHVLASSINLFYFLVLTISFLFFFPFGIGRFGFAAFAVSRLLWFKTMFNFDTKVFHRLVFRCVQTTRKLKETCQWNLNKLKLVASYSASHHKTFIMLNNRMTSFLFFHDSGFHNVDLSKPLAKISSFHGNRSV